MDFKTVKVIDLSEFGTEGTIEMTRPPWTKRREIEAKVARMTPRNPDASPNIINADLASAGMLQIMAYVSKAPFDPNDPESLGKFMDDLDYKNGRAEELWNRMLEIYAEISSGAGSPLQG